MAAVLVTGGSGFIGTNLVQRLLDDGDVVVNADAAPPRNPDHAEQWRHVDICDAGALADLVAEVVPSQVVHLAARTDMNGKTLADYEANTTGMRNLLTALEPCQTAPRLVVASTRMVFEIGYRPRHDTDYNPKTPYGQSKVETERIVRESGYPGSWSLVRPTSIWGPWFGEPYRNFFDAVIKGRYVHPRGRRIHKSFGYVENTVEQIVAVLRRSGPEVDGRTFFLADYEPIEVYDWGERIRSAAGAKPVRSVPLGVLKAGAAAGDLAQRLGWRNPPLTSFRLDNLLTEMLYDLEPTRAVAPEQPVPLDPAVDRTVAWLRDH